MVADDARARVAANGAGNVRRHLCEQTCPDGVPHRARALGRHGREPPAAHHARDDGRRERAVGGRELLLRGGRGRAGVAAVVGERPVEERAQRGELRRRVLGGGGRERERVGGGVAQRPDLCAARLVVAETHLEVGRVLQRGADAREDCGERGRVGAHDGGRGDAAVLRRARERGCHGVGREHLVLQQQLRDVLQRQRLHLRRSSRIGVRKGGKTLTSCSCFSHLSFV